jgi:hypothetical protein
MSSSCLEFPTMDKVMILISVTVVTGRQNSVLYLQAKCWQSLIKGSALWNQFTVYVGSLTSHNPIGLHGLLQG